MKREIKKSWISSVCVSLALAMGISLVLPSIGAYATETPIKEVKDMPQTAAKDDLSQYDRYIEIVNNQYVLSAQGKANINLAEVNQVQQQLSYTNKIIADKGLTIDKENRTATYLDFSSAATSSNNLVSIAARKYKQGVTKIKFRWNYARVYLSKTAVKNIGSGMSLGGIWIPHPIVKTACATLGVVVSRCPGGIWFEYNYFATFLGKCGWQ